MKTKEKGHKLTEFLNFTLGQPEVALAIAGNEKELSELKKELEKKDFSEGKGVHESVKEISSGTKLFFEYKHEHGKELYDFIIQYPSGQVYLFDAQKREPVFVNPNYKNSAVLVLITKSDLKKATSSGFNILENTGMAFRSK